VRRRLLLLAGLLLIAWAAVQFWPAGSSDDPVTTSTVPSPAAVSPTSAMPSATPVEKEEKRVSVKLGGGGKACDTEKVLLRPSVENRQHARSDVAIDVAVTTSGSTPCVLKSKDFDPIAVVQQDSKDVWDSSVCGKRLLPKEITVTPGWATTARTMWTPRKSGKKCDDDEDWLREGDYTLRMGMLGGEPGKVNFTLSKPEPEKPKDEKSDEKSDGDKKSEDKKSDDKSDEKSEKSE
jgi:hypothetical protein